jgi:hypothetical protein
MTHTDPNKLSDTNFKKTVTFESHEEQEVKTVGCDLLTKLDNSTKTES